MCCILFKWNKLRPLLQVAKLSVYNLSNKHVFYSGICCVVCIIKNVRQILIMSQNACRVNCNAVLLYPFHFRMSSSTWSEELWTQWRLWSKVSHIWLLTLWSRFMHYRSKWKAPHQSCSSAWRVCRHKSDPEPAYVPDLIGQVLVFESVIYLYVSIGLSTTLFSPYNDKNVTLTAHIEGWHAIEICSSCTKSDVQFYFPWQTFSTLLKRKILYWFSEESLKSMESKGFLDC